MDFIRFFIARWQTILQLTLEHLVIVLVAMVISILLGVTVGILICQSRTLARIVLNLTSVMMTIPQGAAEVYRKWFRCGVAVSAAALFAPA